MPIILKIRKTNFPLQRKRIYTKKRSGHHISEARFGLGIDAQIRLNNLSLLSVVHHKAEELQMAEEE